MRNALVFAVMLSLSVGAVHSFEDAGPLVALDRASRELAQVVERSCDRELADKAEDVSAKVDVAARELAKRPSDEVAAAGVLVGAIADLEAVVDGHCFEWPIGVALMDDLTAVSRSLAARRLSAALRWRGKRDEIQEARNYLARGDALRARGRRGDLEAFEQAANAYKDALTKAVGAET